MQSWRNQTGRCVFCMAGITRLPPTRILHSRRQMSTTQAQPKRENPKRDRLFPNLARRTTVRRPPLRGGEKRYRRIAIQETDELEKVTESRRSARLLKALNQAKHYLNLGKEDNQDAEKTRQSLDPDGTLWPQFKREITAVILDKHEGQPPESKLDRVRKDIIPLLEDPAVTTERIGRDLHYNFLDWMLSEREIDSSKALASITDLRWPTEWYGATRSIQRDIHLHIGPTNSGKTYNALKRLEAAESGFYAGPLRLLAHEVYSRFKAKGIRCDLVTGDDVREDRDGGERASKASMTVEMVTTGRNVEVAVIDEIQMMASEDRGWAWTRAFLGARAKEVHLCGEARVLPLVQELSALMGDNLHVHRYQRLNPLKVTSRSLGGDLKRLRKGDCVVSFSILQIHALKKQIEKETGRRVAIVYGNLPPETRAQQAEYFNDPDNDFDFLVASDAVGMGLNLAIKRIVFETIEKFNGERRERLPIPQIKQIAGRAGRYRTSHDDKVGQKDSSKAEKSVGLVTCLGQRDLPYIQEALATEAPPIRAAGILPPADFVDEYAARLPAGVTYEYILRRLCDASTTHPRFTLCNIRQQLAIGRCIERVRELTILERCQITAAPADIRSVETQSILLAFARCIAAKREVNVTDIAEVPLEVLESRLRSEREYLQQLETLHRSLVLYLWLSYRFHSVFRDQEMAFHAKELCEQRINEYLMTFSASQKLEGRLRRMQKLQEQMEPTDGHLPAQEQFEHRDEAKDFREGDVQDDYAEEDTPDSLVDRPNSRDPYEMEEERAKPSVQTPYFEYGSSGSNVQPQSNV